MVKLEGTNDIGGPRGDTGDGTKADHARDYAQNVKGTGDWQNTQANLGLHHEDNCSQESHLVSEWSGPSEGL